MNTKVVKIEYWDKPFIKEVFYKSLPLIIATIVTGATALIDSFFVGLFQPKGSSELAALSLGNKYLSFSNIFIEAIVAIFSFLIFQFKGAKKFKEISDTTKIMISLSLGVAIVFIVLAYAIPNQIMQLFQGIHYSKSLSTSTGAAQGYMKVAIFTLLPTSIFTVLIFGVNASGKQKIIVPLSIVSLGINALFDYLFYKVFGFGLNGIMYATLMANLIFTAGIVLWIFHIKLQREILFNPLKIFKWNKEVFTLGSKKYSMALQSMLWSFVPLIMSVIYSRWYGDVASNRLAIAMPIVDMFYSALDGVAATKGYFVGRAIGAKDKDLALANDKKINMYTFIVALAEGALMCTLAFLITKAYVGAESLEQHEAALMLIAVGCTYPIAAMSKCMLGSFKVAGLGKIIILSNGLFAVLFELLIPVILFLIATNTDLLHLDFWQLFLITRLVKLLKLPPTLYFWKKKKWLERVF